MNNEEFRKHFHIDNSSEIKRTRTGEVLVYTPQKEVRLKYSNRAADLESQKKKFPVIIKDKETGPVRLKCLLPSTKVPFHGVVGDVHSVKRLSSGDWYVECFSKAQQKRLLDLQSLAGINTQCHIPALKTEGVIYGAVDAEKACKHPDILKTEPLLSKKKNTAALKITFNLQTLPEKIRVADRWFSIQPFCGPIRRCTRCQRLNHTKKQCRAKHARCSRCSQTSHERDCCTASPQCVNCGGDHSPAFHGCPKKSLLKSAFKIKSSRYMSFTAALQEAKKESQRILPPVQNSHKVQRRTYAQAVTDSGRFSQTPTFPAFVQQTAIPMFTALTNINDSSLFHLFDMYHHIYRDMGPATVFLDKSVKNKVLQLLQNFCKPATPDAQLCFS